MDAKARRFYLAEIRDMLKECKDSYMILFIYQLLNKTMNEEAK